MSATRIRRLVLASFPARFRARYGDELEAVTDECGSGWRITADLAAASALQWMRPTFSGRPAESRRQRLQATTSTVFMAWAVAAVAVAVFARGVDDQPVPGLKSWGWTSYVVGQGVFFVSGAAVLAAGFVYWVRVVVPAWRRRDRRTLQAAATPIAVAVAWLGITLALALASHRLHLAGDRHISARGPASAGGYAALVGYGLVTLGCVVVGAAACVKALARSNLPDQWLARSTVVAAGVAVAIWTVAVAATACLVRVLDVGHVGAWNTMLAVVPVVVLLLAGASSIVSAARGVDALARRATTSP